MIFLIYKYFPWRLTQESVGLAVTDRPVKLESQPIQQSWVLPCLTQAMWGSAFGQIRFFFEETKRKFLALRYPDPCR